MAEKTIKVQKTRCFICLKNENLNAIMVAKGNDSKLEALTQAKSFQLLNTIRAKLTH